MSQAQLPYVLLYLCSTFLSAVSQVLLKKAALREHKSVLAEYTDWRVILGYALFVGCTLLTMLAYKGVPLNVGPVLEATGYIYVTIFGVTIFFIVHLEFLWFFLCKERTYVLSITAFPVRGARGAAPGFSAKRWRHNPATAPAADQTPRQ